MKEREEAWKVTSHASFWDEHSREQPGVPLPFSGDFSMGENRFRVPGVYSCGKGLAVDLCRELDPKAFQAYLEKWGLPLDADYRTWRRGLGPGRCCKSRWKIPSGWNLKSPRRLTGRPFLCGAALLWGTCPSRWRGRDGPPGGGATTVWTSPRAGTSSAAGFPGPAGGRWIPCPWC